MISYRNIKSLACFFAVLFFLFSVELSSHVHPDKKDVETCSLCVAAHHAKAETSSINSPMVAPQLLYWGNIERPPSHISSFLVKNLPPARAPPLV